METEITGHRQLVTVFPSTHHFPSQASFPHGPHRNNKILPFPRAAPPAGRWSSPAEAAATGTSTMATASSTSIPRRRAVRSVTPPTRSTAVDLRARVPESEQGQKRGIFSASFRSDASVSFDSVPTRQQSKNLHLPCASL